MGSLELFAEEFLWSFEVLQLVSFGRLTANSSNSSVCPKGGENQHLEVARFGVLNFLWMFYSPDHFSLYVYPLRHKNSETFNIPDENSSSISDSLWHLDAAVSLTCRAILALIYAMKHSFYSICWNFAFLFRYWWIYGTSEKSYRAGEDKEISLQERFFWICYWTVAWQRWR